LPKVLVHWSNVKGGDFLKGKALMLILLALFAAFTTIAVASLSISSTEEVSGFTSYEALEVYDDIVQPCGISVDSPGGPA
jgi:hypothetical protein